MILIQNKNTQSGFYEFCNLTCDATDTNGEREFGRTRNLVDFRCQHSLNVPWMRYARAS